MHRHARALEVRDQQRVHAAYTRAAIRGDRGGQAGEHRLQVRRQTVEPRARVDHDARLVAVLAQRHVAHGLVPRRGEREERRVVEAIDHAGLQAGQDVGDVDGHRCRAERSVCREVHRGLLRSHPQASEIPRRRDGPLAGEPRSEAVLRPQRESEATAAHRGLDERARGAVEHPVGLAGVVDEVGGLDDVQLVDDAAQGGGRAGEALDRARRRAPHQRLLAAERAAHEETDLDASAGLGLDVALEAAELLLPGRAFRRDRRDLQLDRLGVLRAGEGGHRAHEHRAEHRGDGGEREHEAGAARQLRVLHVASLSGPEPEARKR